MNPQQSKDFIIQNKEQFELLGKYIKEIDTVRGVNTVKDFQGRQIAIGLIKAWLMEIWHIAYEDIMPDEEDDTIRTVTHKKNQEEV